MNNTSTYTGNAFTMPPEVATRMLSNPKNKMTAKQRKRAWAARETARPSQRPMVRYEEGPKKKCRGYFFAPDRSKTGTEKIEGRLKGRKFRQLLIWEKRIAKRIKVLERVVATLTGVLETVTADSLRARIAQLHEIGGLIQAELDARG